MKWGRVGAPHSRKRKLWMGRCRRCKVRYKKKKAKYPRLSGSIKGGALRDVRKWEKV